MPKMTTLLIRLEPELVEAIDKLRGEVPRATYIRNRLAEAVRSRTASAAAIAQRMTAKGDEPSRAPGQRLTLEDVRPKFEPRLKPEKGQK